MTMDNVREVLGKTERIDTPHSEGSVRHLRDNPEALKPRARRILDQLTWSADVKASLERNYLVKGWLDRDSVSVLFGPSNSGKSFLALDLAHHVAKGMTWGGRRVQKSRVLYIAAEGGVSFANRVAALDDPQFWVFNAPLPLTGRDSAAAPLAEVIQHLTATGGAFGLVVVDTLARSMPGADENNAQDIASLISSVDHIRRATGANVMLVHHTGKDVARGARGHSALRAAIDTEIELTRSEAGLISAEVTKQRDGPIGYRFDYTLRLVELGLDQDGDQVTSCLVEPMAAEEVSHAGITGSTRKALDILDKALEANGQEHSKPKYPDGLAISVSAWREACVAPGGLTNSDKSDSQARAFRRCRSELEKAGKIMIRDDLVWRVE